MADPSSKSEFASPQWILAACDIVERELAKADLDGIDYVMGEEFLNVPPRLNPDGNRRVGWTIEVRKGAVQARPGPPPDDADSTNIVDWAAIEHLSHHVFGLDPELDSRVRQETAGLERARKLARIVRRPQPEALQTAFARVHNLIVDITGPRGD